MPLAIAGYLRVQSRPRARQEFDPATVEPRMHAVADELDFVQTLVTFRRRGRQRAEPAAGCRLAAGLSVYPRLAGAASGPLGFIQMAVAALGTLLLGMANH